MRRKIAYSMLVPKVIIWVLTRSFPWCIMGMYPYKISYTLAMPNLDGTGPLGAGPISGRGRGVGSAALRRGRGAAQSSPRGLGGSKECTCPKCGHTEPHVRGVPCSEKKCTKCGTSMKGVFCL